MFYVIVIFFLFLLIIFIFILKADSIIFNPWFF